MKLSLQLARDDWQVKPLDTAPAADHVGDEARRQPPARPARHYGLYVADKHRAWDGLDRREQEDRRLQDRRDGQLLTLLDTRSRQDRRREGRRASDQLTLSGFYFKA